MTKKTYTKPALNIVTFRAERGYQASTSAFTPRNIIGMIELIKCNEPSPSYFKETESFSTRSGWDSDHQSAFWQ